MEMKLVNVGFGNMVSSDKLVAIVGHQSAPVKRMIQEARDSGYLIDATYGRKTRAVIIMDSGHIVLSAIQPETVSGRFDDNSDLTISDTEEEETEEN
ncbi:MAG: DUF370 domain-containing protein [Clostridia bacterium]|nr:DUF370 domain-containing protein [Clostridia bacterium]